MSFAVSSVPTRLVDVHRVVELYKVHAGALLV